MIVNLVPARAHFGCRLDTEGAISCEQYGFLAPAVDAMGGKRPPRRSFSGKNGRTCGRNKTVPVRLVFASMSLLLELIREGIERQWGKTGGQGCVP